MQPNLLWMNWAGSNLLILPGLSPLSPLGLRSMLSTPPGFLSDIFCIGGLSQRSRKDKVESP